MKKHPSKVSAAGVGQQLAGIIEKKQAKSVAATTADLIKRARHADDRSHPAYVSQAELARRIGVNQSAVAHWETGNNNQSVTHLRAIAMALDVPLSELMGDELPGMMVRDPEAVSLLMSFDRLTSEQRAAILMMARTLAGK